MKSYQSLLHEVLTYGQWSENRTGVKTKHLFGQTLRHDMANGFPLLTTKFVSFKNVINELLWYLSGQDHIRELKKKTKIWDNWADEYGNLETAYGRFWRRFPSKLAATHQEPGERWSNTSEIDQVEQILNGLLRLRNNPSDVMKRRLVLNAWHPGNAIVSKLPPCHVMAIFNVTGAGKDLTLNLSLTQRSGDIGIGIPYNIASYCALLQMFAEATGMIPGEFLHTIVDAHIYENHIEDLEKQMELSCKDLPRMKIYWEDYDNIDRVERIISHAYAPVSKPLVADMFEIVGYDPHPAIKLDVAV